MFSYEAKNIKFLSVNGSKNTRSLAAKCLGPLKNFITYQDTQKSLIYRVHKQQVGLNFVRGNSMKLKLLHCSWKIWQETNEKWLMEKYLFIKKKCNNFLKLVLVFYCKIVNSNFLDVIKWLGFFFSSKGNNSKQKYHTNRITMSKRMQALSLYHCLM